jgi:hypothetical protein
MSAVVWILAGIFVVNLCIAGWLITLGLAERYRRQKAMREVDALERTLAMPSAGTGTVLARRMEGTLRSVAVRERVASAHRSAAVGRLPAVPRPVRKASISLALAGMVLWALVAIPDFGDRRAIRSSDDRVGLRVPVTRERSPDRGTSSHFDSDRARMGHRPPEAGDPIESQTEVPPTNSNTGTAFEAETLIERVVAQPHSATQIQLAWEAVAGAIGYTIHRRGDDGSGSGWSVVASVPAVTVYTDVGLEADTTYYYRVSALTDEGLAPPSDVVSATTSIAPPNATTVTALVTATTIDLTWLDVANETAYRVERSRHGTSSWTLIGTTGQDVTTYTDAALSAGVTYRYRIIATNAGGDSTPSNVASGKVDTVKITTPPDDQPSPSPKPHGGKPGKVKTPPATGKPSQDTLGTEESAVSEDSSVAEESSFIESI